MTTRPGYIWSGTEWVSIGQEAVVAPVSYQASAPSTPSTGDIWIDSNDDVPGIDTSQFLRWRKTMAGGETSVSGIDDNGLTLAYTPNYEQVYLNGVLLVRGQDYTATNGTSITGLTALAANDVVEVYGVVARVVGDVYTQAQTNSLLDTKSNVSSTGLVLLNDTTGNSSSTTFTTAASVSFNNIFTSSYVNYRIVMQVEASTSLTIRMRLRTSGTDNTTSNYSQGVFGVRSTNATTILYSGASLAYLDVMAAEGDSIGSNCSMDIYNPQLTEYTRASYLSSSRELGQTANIGLFGSYLFNGTTQFDGFTIYPTTGTITGTIKVYGYK